MNRGCRSGNIWSTPSEAAVDKPEEELNSLRNMNVVRLLYAGLLLNYFLLVCV